MLASISVLLMSMSLAQEPEVLIKAAYVYNLTQLVSWPAERGQDQKFRVGVLGADPKLLALHTLSGRSVGTATIEVTQVGPEDELTEFRLLFIADADGFEETMIKLADAPILTVSDFEGFGSMGGMIELAKQRNKIRLRINLESARRAGLKLSSQVIKIAETI